MERNGLNIPWKHLPWLRNIINQIPTTKLNLKVLNVEMISCGFQKILASLSSEKYNVLKNKNAANKLAMKEAVKHTEVSARQ